MSPWMSSEIYIGLISSQYNLTCLRYLPQSCYIKENNNANARDNLNKLISNKE